MVKASTAWLFTAMVVALLWGGGGAAIPGVSWT